MSAASFAEINPLLNLYIVRTVFGNKKSQSAEYSVFDDFRLCCNLKLFAVYFALPYLVSRFGFKLKTNDRKQFSDFDCD